MTLLHRDGHEVPVQGSATVLGDRGGPVRGFLVILRDITHEQEAELRARARFEKLVNFSADIITVFGADRRLKYTSPQGQRVLGWQDDDLPAGILSALHPDDLPAAEAALDELFAGTWGPDRPLTFRIRGADGGWHHFESRGVDLSTDPDIAGVVITSRDVTERERLASQLAHAARHDHLTGLANRASFAEQLEQAMARVDRAGTSLGACYLDLDHFKPVNDTHGHAVGDEVLVSVADRLRQTCRQGDVAARLGGRRVRRDHRARHRRQGGRGLHRPPRQHPRRAARHVGRRHPVPGHHRLGPQRAGRAERAAPAPRRRPPAPAQGGTTRTLTTRRHPRRGLLEK